MLAGVKPSRANPVSANATTQTVNLYRWLLTAKQHRRYAFGTSDQFAAMPATFASPTLFNTVPIFQAATGKYPGVVSLEYHDPLWTSRYGSTGTTYMRDYAIAAYAQGAIIMLHNHAGNPVTGLLEREGQTYPYPGGDYAGTGYVYDMTGTPLTAINTGGAKEAEFLAYLDRLATFFASLVDARGRLIPVIFRPFHELTGNFFWWGGADRAATLILVWRKMVNYLRDTKGVTNVLFCWNPDIQGDSNLAAYWPGPTYVDVISADIYDSSSDGSTSLDRGGTTQSFYNALVALGTTHNKPLALSELGYTTGASTISDIWDVRTGRLLVNKYRQFALAALWRAPWGPALSDSTAIKTSLSNMASSPYALTAERLTGVFK